MRFVLFAVSLLLLPWAVGCDSTPKIGGRGVSSATHHVGAASRRADRTGGAVDDATGPSGSSGSSSNTGSSESGNGGTSSSGSSGSSSSAGSGSAGSSGNGSNETPAPAAYSGPEPSRSELSGAEYRLKKFEQQVTRMKGAPFRLRHDDKEAQKRIEALAGKFAGHPGVQELENRLAACINASKGTKVVITPEMMAYRERENEIIDTISRATEKAWAEYRERLIDDGAVFDAFPALDPEDADSEDDEGRIVIVEKALRHPYNLFGSIGEAYMFMGDTQRGFWFLEANGREFLAVYNAIKRYRQRVTQSVPQPWTLVGRITEPTLLVPQAGDETFMAAHAGWMLEPMALYVPGRALAILGDDGTAEFIGESSLDALLAEQFTITEVASGATPTAVITAYLAALKEKNWDLFHELVHTDLKGSAISEERLRMSWQRSQEGYAKRYVHAEVARVQTGSRGETTAWVEVYDQHGEMVRSASPIKLRKTIDGEWRVFSGLSF